jgi:hypothetical protein
LVDKESLELAVASRARDLKEVAEGAPAKEAGEDSLTMVLEEVALTEEDEEAAVAEEAATERRTRTQINLTKSWRPTSEREREKISVSSRNQLISPIAMSLLDSELDAYKNKAVEVKPAANQA